MAAVATCEPLEGVWEPDFMALARPKSMIFTWPRVVRKMFASLISR